MFILIGADATELPARTSCAGGDYNGVHNIDRIFQALSKFAVSKVLSSPGAGTWLSSASRRCVAREEDCVRAGAAGQAGQEAAALSMRRDR
jgi:hypothetical protein